MTFRKFCCTCIWVQVINNSYRTVKVKTVLLMKRLNHVYPISAGSLFDINYRLYETASSELDLQTKSVMFKLALKAKWDTFLECAFAQMYLNGLRLVRWGWFAQTNCETTETNQVRRRQTHSAKNGIFLIYWLMNVIYKKNYFVWQVSAEAACGVR